MHLKLRVQSQPALHIIWDRGSMLVNIYIIMMLNAIDPIKGILGRDEAVWSIHILKHV